jgi:hypothetical protein
VIDYDIFGDDMQYVEIELDPGEAAIGEAGMMMFMQDGVEMETVFGDGSAAQAGLLGKLMGAGKRLLTGESLFTTVYANQAQRQTAGCLFRTLSWQDHPHGSVPHRRHPDLPEGRLPLRRQGRQPRHCLPAPSGRRLLRRRRLHPAKTGG